MALLQVMSYDSYPFDSDKNFIKNPQNGLERHLSGLHQQYWEKSYYLLINDYNQSLSVKCFTLDGDIVESYQLSQEMTNQFGCPNQEQLQRNLQMIVEQCKIEVVHFHFQKPIVLDMVKLFSRFENLKLIQTMHDLSYACGNYYEDYNYIVPSEVEQKINLLHEIIFPDKAVEVIYRKQMKIVAPTRIIAHGVDMKKIDIEQTDELKILFLGALGKEKGGEIVAEIVKSDLPNISWHILGRIETPSLQEQKTYTYHGTYTSYDLQVKLEEIQPDLIVIPSQMIETFSYNLADSLAVGIPVLVPKKGAFLRIEHDNIGWFVEGEQTAEKYIEQILKIRFNKADYQIKKQTLQNYQIKTVREMDFEYQNIYGYAQLNKDSLAVKSLLTAQTVEYEKKQYHQLVQTHQAFLREQHNAEEHVKNYQLLAAAHNSLADIHSNLIKEHEKIVREFELQSRELEQVKSLLSRRIIGRLNRYLLNKDSISKK